MLKITSTEKKGKYFWKYESKFGRSITNAKSSISQSVKAWAWFTGSYNNNNLPPTPQPPNPNPNFHIRANFVCDGRYCCNRSLNITEKLNSNRFDIQKGRYTVFSIQWESRDLKCLIWIFVSQKLRKKNERGNPNITKELQKAITIGTIP